jgi:hypothetical protein
MPEWGKPVQAVEALVDIRPRQGTSSGNVVFDSEHLDGGNEQESSTPVDFAAN